MKNKWIWLAILVIMILGAGGKIYMNKNEEKNQIVQAEKDLSEYIVQNYEGVKKIKFDEVNFNKMTGSWTFSVVINESNDISFSSFDLNEIETNLTTIMNPKDFTLTEKNDKNKKLDDVEIILVEVK